MSMGMGMWCLFGTGHVDENCENGCGHWMKMEMGMGKGHEAKHGAKQIPFI